MRRREFLGVLGGAAARPIAARAQQAMLVIGYLGGRSAQTDVPMLAAFRQGLAENSYVEGQNVAIEYRWGEGQYDSLPVGSQTTLSSKSRSSHTYGDESANQNPTDLGGRLA